MIICTACPRQCGVERMENKPSKGVCKMPYNAMLARAGLHFWEEPVISGQNGSGAIFFSGCSLRCIFCQNFEISHGGFGKAVSTVRFIEIMQDLEAQGAHNINLVNPTHFVPFIADALRQYKPKIPVVYNSGGYDSVESLKSLEGLVDVYLPDFKYFDNDIAQKYSAAADYPELAKAAILEMRRQTGTDEVHNGLMQRGLLIRHLILPRNTGQSIKILRWIRENLPADTYVSLMSQYTPCGRTYPYKELNRRLMTAEYQKVLDTFFDLGLSNGFMQEREAADIAYIPDFNLFGV